MEKPIGDNLRIRILRQQIVDDMNNSNLPFEVLRMILNEVLNEVTDLTQKALQEETKSLKEGDSKNGLQSDNICE